MSLRSIKRSAIFFAGNIRRERCLGGFAWGRFEHKIDYREALSALPYIEHGAVGLHRNCGDLSNKGIPGFMKHVWIHTPETMIVEAVSEGVLHRHPLHPLMSDFVIILSPDGIPGEVREEAKDEACHRALMQVELGLEYDENFKFDLEIEESLFADKVIALANMKKYKLGVTCSESVALDYVGHRRQLALYRTRLGKRLVILPDAYISTHWKIKWASKEATPENAAALGLHEEGCDILNDYWKGR